MTSPRDHKDLDLLLVDAQLRCAHEDQLCLGAQGPYVAAGYHDDDYHYTLPCVGGPTDRQAAAQPRLRLTAAAGRAATLQPPSRLVAHPSREFRLLPAVLAHESVMDVWLRSKLSVPPDVGEQLALAAQLGMGISNANHNLALAARVF